MNSDGQSALDRFLDVLSVQRQSELEFVGHNPQRAGRLYGGLVAAQATVAAGRTAGDMTIHSLHAYFLRPGQPDEPIRYQVDVLKEGRNFRARHVLAKQGAETIFSMSTSYTRAQPGIAHQDPMPPAPPPEQAGPMPPRPPAMRRIPRFNPGIELRYAEPAEPHPSQHFLWFRPEGQLPEDPLLHTAAYVYMSDRTLMGTGARPHRSTHTRRGGASLDHAIWFHRHLPFEGFILYAMDSPAAHAARALNRGAMYTEQGARILSVAQEGLLRMEPVEDEAPE